MFFGMNFSSLSVQFPGTVWLSNIPKVVPYSQFRHSHLVSKAKTWYLASVSGNVSGHVEFTSSQNVLAFGCPGLMCVPCG